MKISKNKAMGAVASIAGLVSPVVSVSAEETVVRTTEAGKGSDVISSGATATTVTSGASVKNINSAISALAAKYPGLVSVSNKAVQADENTIKAYQAQLSTIQSLINELKSKQRNDVDTLVSGDIGEVEDDEAFGSDANKLSSSSARELVSKLNNAINDLNQKANEVINPDLNVSAVKKAIDKANKEITNTYVTTAGTNADGVTGVNEDIRRKAEDSNALNENGGIGVVVDTSETSTVSSTGAQETQETVVAPIDQQTDTTVTAIEKINALRNQLMDEIKNQASKNTNDVLLDAGTYRDNALQNIDQINGWLAEWKVKAANIKETLIKNSTSISSYENYISRFTAQLTAAREKAQNISNDKIKAQTLASIDKALETVRSSGLEVRSAGTVDAISNVNFGDIGQAIDGILAIEKAADASANAIIDANIDKVKASNDAAEAKLAGVKDSNEAAMTQFLADLDEVLKRAVTQIDDAWVEARKIYQESGSYRGYVKAALLQTQEDVDGVFKSVENKGNGITIKKVDTNTSAAKASAAEYKAQSENGFDNGFGSVMLPSKNINDFATVQGNKYANSQNFTGGAKGILDRLNSTTILPGTGGVKLYDRDFAVINDILNQHINAVGNENVFLVVSEKPTATFNLKNSFVSVDADGNARAHDMTLKLSLESDSGGSPRTMPSNAVARAANLYFFYMSVDPATGALVTGGGRLPLYASGAGTGKGGFYDDGGELKLGLASNAVNDEYNILSDSRRVYPGYDASFLQAEGAARSFTDGLVLRFDVSVDNSAEKWASYAPLYISDIDDGQYLSINKGSNLDVIVGNSSVTTTDNGSTVSITTSDLGKNNGANGTTNLDSQSVLIFGAATDPSQSVSGVGIGHSGSTGGYNAIDVALFAPFGVVGSKTAEVSLDGVNATLETFEIGDPSAIAKSYSQGKTSSTLKTIEWRDYIRETDGRYTVELPQFTSTPTEEKIVASNTSLVVRQQKSSNTRTASGNSMTVRQLDENKRTASGNSMTIRTLTTNKRTASGNSLVVREINIKKTTASGNGFVIRELGQATTNNSISDTSLISQVLKNTGVTSESPVTVSQPVSTTVATTEVADKVSSGLTSTDTVKVPLKIFVESEISDAAKQAVKLWADAFMKFGLELDVTYTSDKSALMSGVDLAILASTDTSTRFDRAASTLGVENDAEFEMSALAGLASVVANNVLSDVDANDKLDADGEFKSTKDFAKVGSVIQLNVSNQVTDEDKYTTIAHELGHFFGLDHDDSDPLMTTYRESVVAIISDKDVQKALLNFKLS